MPPTLTGWLFDVYPSDDGMVVWILDEQGRAHALRDTFTPSFYVSGPASELRAVGEMLRSRHAPVALRRTERRDLFLDREIEVLEVGVRRPELLPALVRQTSDFRPDLTYYDADIPLAQHFVLARGAFPLAFCAVDHQGGRIQRLQALDTPWEIDYRLPPLRVMTMRLDGELKDPAHDPGTGGAHTPGSDRDHRPGSDAAHGSGDLLVEIDGDEYGFGRERGRELVLGIRQLLERHDPDLILSAYGDSYLLPRLIALARHYHIDLPLNRDPAQAVAHKPAHSYFSYGRIVFRDEQHLLFGRWHIDRQNAFLAGDYGVDGTLEIARLSGLPVQTTARVSTGTGISAMQVATALRRGVLVPWQKRHPETLKTGLDLIVADKGGLVYTPIAGLHEHVAELDFTAMYPSIMVHFNISPETVGPCRCEERGQGERHAVEGGIGDTEVPELGTPICRHRVGLVPETLAPLLEKRALYKARMRELPEGDRMREIYRRRYSAHKWLLVTCFGYLGYKNARFGRIEAHESVTAYGREVLIRSKEWVEQRGFRVLHLFVDALWIYRPLSGGHERERGTEVEGPDYERLIGELCRETGLHIGLEGVYRWVAFLPSRVDPRSSVPNRYFGAFEGGEIKVRGIEARRHDTPEYIEGTQRGMLEILARGEDAEGFRRCLPEAITYARGRLGRLRAGEVPVCELVVRHNLSRRLEEFTVRTAAARAAGQMARAGIELSPGESVRFVYSPGPEKARAWDLLAGEIPYDREVYTELLARAVHTVVMALGVDRQTVDMWLLGGAGYWGPPGSLPPAGSVDLRAPVLAVRDVDGDRSRPVRWLPVRPPKHPALPSHGIETKEVAAAPLEK